MVTEIMENIVKKLIAYRLAKKDQIIGCTQEEIEKLETYYKLTLPNPYKEFLFAFGKRSGNFSGDLAISFQFLFDFKKRALEMLRYDNSDVKLPDDAFVFNTFDGDLISQCVRLLFQI